MTTIARWLAQSVAPVDAARLRVAGAVEVSEGRYFLSLWLDATSGRAHERFAADSCETLVEVLALKVALAATTAEVESLSLPISENTAAPTAWSLRLSGLLSAGHLPGLSPGIAFDLGWSFASLRLELGVSYAPPRAARYSAYPEAGVDVQLVSGLARACVAARLADLALLTCGGIGLGWMRAAGVATLQPEHSDQAFASIEFGPALRIGLTRAFGLWLELGASLAVVRPSGFYLRTRASGSPLPDVYRSDFAAGRVTAGIEMQLR
jgi:hypothetical protein